MKENSVLNGVDLSEAARQYLLNKESRMQSVQTPSEPQVEQNETLAGDTVDAFQHGVGKSVSGLAEFGHLVTGSETLRDWSQQADDWADSQVSEMTDEGQASFGKSFVQEDENGNLETGEGLSDYRSWLLQGSSLLGQVAAEATTGYGLTGGAKLVGKAVFKNAAKRAAAAGASQSQAIKHAETALERLKTAGGQGLSGMAVTGGMLSNEARDEIKVMSDAQLDESQEFRRIYWRLKSDMPKASVRELRDLAKHSLADRAAREVGLNPKLLLTNFALEAVGGKFVDDVLKGRGTGNRFTNSLLQSGVQGATEAGQGASEQYIQNEGMQHAGFDVGAWDGVAAAGLNEGVIAGGLGGVAGALRKGRGYQGQNQTQEGNQQAQEDSPEPTIETVSREEMDANNEQAQQEDKYDSDAKALQFALNAHREAPAELRDLGRGFWVEAVRKHLDGNPLTATQQDVINYLQKSELLEQEVTSESSVTEESHQQRRQRMLEFAAQEYQHAPADLKRRLGPKGFELAVKQFMRDENRVAPGYRDAIEYLKKRERFHRSKESQPVFESTEAIHQEVPQDVPQEAQQATTEGIEPEASQPEYQESIDTTYTQTPPKASASPIPKEHQGFAEDIDKRLLNGIDNIDEYTEDKINESAPRVNEYTDNELSPSREDIAELRSDNEQPSAAILDDDAAITAEHDATAAIRQAEPTAETEQGIAANSGESIPNSAPSVQQDALLNDKQIIKPEPIERQAEVLQGQPVAEVSKSDVPQTGIKAVREWAMRVFRGWDYKAKNPILGEIELNRNSVRSSLNHGKPTKFKLAAFGAVKDVLEKGSIVEAKNIKGEYNYYVSAPIRTDGSIDITTVLVKKDPTTQRMYLHSVTSKESLIETKTELPMTPNRETVPDQSQVQQKTSSADIHNILHKALTFKKEQQPIQSNNDEPEAQAQAPKEKIEDVGEKLGGARKDEFARLREQLAKMSDDEIAQQTNAKLFPKNAVNKIEDPLQAAFYDSVRVSLPNKPRRPQQIRHWVKLVKGAKETIDEFAGERLSEFLEKAQHNSVLKPLAARTELLSKLPKDNWSRVGSVDVNVDRVRVEIDKQLVQFGDKHSIQDALIEIQEALSNKPEKTQVKQGFEIRSTRDSVFINKKGDREYRRLKEFDDVDSARAFLKENTEELTKAWEAVKKRDNVSKNDVRGSENGKRLGKNYREGKNITAESFAETFGFRGVEFGNWVNDKERQSSVNDAYDALMDLADLIGIPATGISLEGRLGLGFGSRGRGGKANAHYEPDKLVINLTKTKGAGSLAHEWFHALDNYFSSKRGDKDFITNQPEPMMVSKVSHYKITKETFLKRQKKEQEEGVTDGVYASDKWEQDKNHKSGVRPEMEEAFSDLVRALNDSPMAQRAAKIDKKPNAYWSQIIERAARAFETYVVSRMADKGAGNDYLVNVTPIEGFKRNPERYPYLTDEEQEPVNNTFDTLFKTLKHKTEDGKTVLFSRKKENLRAPDNPKETKASKKPTNESVSSHLEQVKSWHDKLSEEFGIKAEVVADADHLPDELRAFIPKDDIPEGFYYQNKAYLIASEIQSYEDAARVYLHEAIGHKAVIDLLHKQEANGGKPVLEMLDDMAKQVGRIGIERNIKRYGFDFKDPKQRREATLEYIAHLAETGRRPDALQRIIIALRDFIRRLFNLSWTDTDTLGLIERAKRVNKEGQVKAFSASPITLNSLSEEPNSEFAKAVDYAAQGDVSRGYVKMGTTPKVLSLLGLPDTSIRVKGTVIEKAMGEYLGVQKGKYRHIHNLTPDVLKQLPKQINDPVAVFNSTTTDNAYVVLTELSEIDTKGGVDKPVIVALHVKQSKSGIDVIDVASAYGRSNKQLETAFRNDLRYLNKEKAQQFLNTVSLLQESKAPNNSAKSLALVSDFISDVELSNSNIKTENDLTQISTPLKSLKRRIEEDTTLNQGQKAFLNGIGSENISFKERVSERVNEVKKRMDVKIRQGMIDRYASLMELDKQWLAKSKKDGDITSEQNITESSWVRARMSNVASGAVTALMNTGRIFLNKEGVIDIKKDTRGLVYSLSQLGSAKEVERFFGWIVANRAEKLAKEDKELLFSTQDIEAGKTLNQGQLDDGRNRVDVYKKVFEEFQEHRNDVLMLAERAGIIKPEDRASWENDFYVPFYRVFEDSKEPQSFSVNQGGLTRQQAFKQLKGSKRKIQDPLHNTLMNFHHLIDASMKNMAAKQAIDNATDLGIARLVHYKEKVNNRNITHVMVEGKKVRYEITDDLTYKAVEALGNKGLDFFGMKAMRGFKRLFTNMTTTTPGFLVANLLRDSLSAVSTSELKYNPVGNVVSGLKNYGILNTHGYERARLLASGGGFSFGHVYGEDAEAIKNSIDGQLKQGGVIKSRADALKLLKVGTVAWQKWQQLQDSAENANRMSAFKQNEDKGSLYAAFQARDIMDFSGQGAWPVVRFLVDTVPFLNARLQGLDKLYRSGIKPSAKVALSMLTSGKVDVNATEKQMAARFTAVVGALSLATIALYLNNKDNEEYKKLEEWDKDTYWHIFADNHHFRLPKPFEQGAIATLFERLTEQMVDDDATGELFAQRLWHMLTNTFGFSPRAQMFNPAYEIAINRNTFLDRPIENFAQRNLRDPTLRVNNNTSIAAKTVSSGLVGVFGEESSLSLSPVQVDHLIHGYLGSVGAWVVSWADTAMNVVKDNPDPAKNWYEYQPVGRFYRDTNNPRYTKYTTLFYEALSEASGVYRDIRELRKQGETVKALEKEKRHRNLLQYRRLLNRTQSTLRGIRKQMQQVRANKHLSSEEKRRRIDLLKTRINQITEKLMPLIDKKMH